MIMVYATAQKLLQGIKREKLKYCMQTKFPKKVEKTET